eukprot:7901369-Pyramimonas_sp.AAC.2
MRALASVERGVLQSHRGWKLAGRTVGSASAMGKCVYHVLFNRKFHLPMAERRIRFLWFNPIFHCKSTVFVLPSTIRKVFRTFEGGWDFRPRKLPAHQCRCYLVESRSACRRTDPTHARGAQRPVGCR